MGVVCYIEGTGIGPYEGARVTVEPSGKVRCATGVGTQGQGHFTMFAQLVAERSACRRRRGPRGDRRYPRVQLGHRHVCEPGRGGGGQRLSCGGDGGAGQDSRAGERGPERAARTAGAAGGRVSFGGRRIGASRWASCPGGPTRCAARSVRAPSRASRAPRTSVPTAATPPAACTR